MEAPRGAREPTGTNGPTLNNNPNQQRGRVKEQQTTLCRNHYTNHDQPTPPHAHKQEAERGGTVLNTKLVVVTAPGKRPAPFRTWKLSPAAPMVLQPIGCGRVGHRHNTPKQERPETFRFLAAPSIHTPGSRHRGIHATAEQQTFTLPRSCGETGSLIMGKLSGPVTLRGTCVLSNMGFSLSSAVDAFIVVEVSIRL